MGGGPFPGCLTAMSLALKLSSLPPHPAKGRSAMAEAKVTRGRRLTALLPLANLSHPVGDGRSAGPVTARNADFIHSVHVIGK